MAIYRQKEGNARKGIKTPPLHRDPLHVSTVGQKEGNARKGIKTTTGRCRCGGRSPPGQKEGNARKGIKTPLIARRTRRPSRCSQKEGNARKGIKTPTLPFQVGRPPLKVRKKEMPARALRPTAELPIADFGLRIGRVPTRGRTSGSVMRNCGKRIAGVKGRHGWTKRSSSHAAEPSRFTSSRCPGDGPDARRSHRHPPADPPDHLSRRPICPGAPRRCT